MQQRRLGAAGPLVDPLGLGCMGMSGTYGPADRAASIATIHAALEEGPTLIDTGDFYGMGHNEMLIGEALRGRDRDRAIISVKFGALRDAAGAWSGYDLRPRAVKNFLAYTLRRLGVDHIDIYRPARLDPDVPIEETVGAIADAIAAGWVRHIGLSEVGVPTLRRAASVHPICDLQIEYSLFSRGIEDSILPACRELGIGVTAYGVLARGMLGGTWRAAALTPGDIRAHSPRYQAAHVAHNLALVEALRAIATARGMSVAQLAIAWVAAQGGDILPLIGTQRPERWAEARGALASPLSSEDLATIERAVPKGAASGERYPAAQMAHLDSEQGAHR